MSKTPLSKRDIAFVCINNLLCLLATVLLLLRIYTYFYVVRKRGGKALFWAVVAWVWGFPCMMIYDYATFNHRLKHRSAYRFSSFALMLISISFARLGVLMYIFEVQGKVYRLGRILLLVVIVINFCLSTGYIILALIHVACAESKGNLPHIQCPPGMRIVHVFVVVAAWSAMTDILFAIYPGFLIWKLKLSRKAKLIIIVLMGSGALAAVCAIGKMVDFGISKAVKHISSDFTVAQPATGPYLGDIFHVAEMWVLLITSSAAPLWPLFRRMEKDDSQVKGRDYSDTNGGSSGTKLADLETRQLGSVESGYDTNELEMENRHR